MIEIGSCLRPSLAKTPKADVRSSNLTSRPPKVKERPAESTFFWVGWLAEKHPNLIAKVAKEGHEIASHSFWHQAAKISYKRFAQAGK